MLDFSHDVFLEVAKQLSFSRAAELLFISQPAISRHIKSLEQHYHISLFERKGNSILLTDEGKLLFDYLKKAKELQR
ncbi:MAG TPA: LysR family transcriptional regulator, partial [Acidobacteriota bacterium]